MPAVGITTVAGPVREAVIDPTSTHRARDRERERVSQALRWRPTCTVSCNRISSTRSRYIRICYVFARSLVTCYSSSTKVPHLSCPYRSLAAQTQSAPFQSNRSEGGLLPARSVVSPQSLKKPRIGWRPLFSPTPYPCYSRHRSPRLS